MKTQTAKYASLLKQISAAAEARNKARLEMERIEQKRLMPLVLKAAESGCTLRDIGEAVGVSHVTIMRMIERHSDGS